MKTKEFILLEDYATEVTTMHNADGTADVESKGQVYQKGNIITVHKLTKESAFTKDNEGQEVPIPRDMVDLAHPEEVKSGKKVIPKAKRDGNNKSSSNTNPNSSKNRRIIMKVAIGIGIYVVLLALIKSFKTSKG